MTLFLVSADNVFAEGGWQFGFEIANPWIECSSGYTGSTADALGCSASSFPEQSARFDVRPDKLPVRMGILKLSTNTKNSDPIAPSFDEVGGNSGAFWTMGNGETLGYSQVMVSAMLHRSDVELVSKPDIEVTPEEADIETVLGPRRRRGSRCGSGSGAEPGSEPVFDSELEFAPDTGDSRGFLALVCICATNCTR